MNHFFDFFKPFQFIFMCFIIIIQEEVCNEWNSDYKQRISVPIEKFIQFGIKSGKRIKSGKNFFFI